jgi:hypothetical protein
MTDTTISHKELLELHKAFRAQLGFDDPLVKYYADLIIRIANGLPHEAIVKRGNNEQR